MNEHILNRLTAAGITARESISHLMNDEQIYFKYLKKFAAKDDYYLALIDAFDNGDCEAAFRAAHTLRGNVGNLGIQSMYAILIDMTESLRNGDMESQRRMLTALKEAYNAVCTAITQAFS